MNKGNSLGSYKVCSDCGITSTPLWRGGPNGPKTMCNACGIRWKRANQSSHKNKSSNYEPSAGNTNARKPKQQKQYYYSEDEFDVLDENEMEDDISNSPSNFDEPDQELFQQDADLGLAIKGVNPFNHSITEQSSGLSQLTHEVALQDADTDSETNKSSTLTSNGTETEPKEPNSTKSDKYNPYARPIPNTSRLSNKRKLVSSSKKPYKRPLKRDSELNLKKDRSSHFMIMNSKSMETEAENSMLILQQAAEEYDRLNDELSLQERMEHLYYEVLALRQELEKRDAVIDMYRNAANQQKLKLESHSQPQSPIQLESQSDSESPVQISQSSLPLKELPSSSNSGSHTQSGSPSIGGKTMNNSSFDIPLVSQTAA